MLPNAEGKESEAVPTKLRFGVLAPQIVPIEVQRARWTEVEELGFDSLWVADHLVNPNMPSGRWFEAWTLLAAAAVATSRVRLGALVTSITFRHPVVLAKEALTVDHLSNGRLNLGIGAAGAPNDFGMTGLPEWSNGERARRFRESVEILDRLLRSDEASYEGRYYRVAEAVMNPGPVQRPRPHFTLAAHGPYTLKVAAEYADTWNSSGSMRNIRLDTPEQVIRAIGERSRILDEHCAAIGRDPAAITRSILAGGGATPDTPWASVEAFHDFIGRYTEVGITEFIFYYPSRTEKSSGAWEPIVHEVMPKLRE